MASVQPLPADALYRRTDPDQFKFETTNDLPSITEVVGQPRAVDALHFGIGIRQDGYNIFALGPTGTGKRSLIRQFFDEHAVDQPVPPDWCYVYNFEQRHRPRVIRLPAGQGENFKRDMDKLVEELRSSLSAAFESDEYRARRQVIEQEFQERQEKALEGLQQKAQERNLSLMRTPGGLVFAPLKNGEVLSAEDFQKLPEEERKEIETHLEEFQRELQKLLQMVPGIQREIRERLHELNREIITFAVGGLLEEIRNKYSAYPDIVTYLTAVQEDVVENADDFLAQDESSEGESNQQNALAMLVARSRASQPSALNRYKVNLLVDNSKAKGAPVIYEDNPNYQNLIGRVEHIAQMGALVTDFTLIKPGALHLANGGYLILDARKLLTQPFAWEALKRALQSCLIQIETVEQMLSMISTVSLEPEPIPLDVKVALFGDRMLYYLLAQADPEFNELFKVEADFADQMNRDPENQELYARMIATLVHQNNLKAFNRLAVARVIDHSSRLVEDSEKLSTQMQKIADLLREADYWASTNGNGVVTEKDVQKAIENKIYRSDRVRSLEDEAILRNIYLIDTQSARVGQVNGLSVIQIGNFAFGRPSRITARVWTGENGVIDIERQVEMGGPIHSKGVLILTGFLGGRYAHEKPLALDASLVFEQSYSGVEGDSASSAETYALLSAISEVPIKQSLAVTGSINQNGQIQAIGGVNEKIEGFFDICKSRGLTGEQGVLIPISNVKNLMLRQDVVEAVKEGKFAIYPVETVDQGIELLTGISAGEKDAEGNYPPDTVNGRVQARLTELAEKRARFGRDHKDGDSKDGHHEP